jgi:hypothetical protein
MTRKLISFLLLTAFFLVGTTDNPNVSAAEDTPSYCSIPLDERSESDGFDYTLCTVQTNIYEGVEVYEGEFVTSEGTYNRISYNAETGKWHGVTVITDINVMQDTVFGDWTRFDIKFSRDIEYLDSVEIKWTTQRDCTTVLGVCLPWTVEEPAELQRIFYNTEDDEAWYQGDDNISYYGDIPLIGERDISLEYDYSIKVYNESRPVDTVMILEYVYILTDEEIIQLALDIQDQYDYEVGIIASDNTLTVTEKNLLLQDLNLEYGQIPELEFGMTFREECFDTDENCIEVLPPTDESTAPLPDEVLDDWFEEWGGSLLEKVAQLIIYTISILLGGGFVAYLVYRFALKGLEGTGYVLWETTKLGAKSGSYWGNQLGNGFISFFKYLFLGLKAIGTGIASLFTK